MREVVVMRGFLVSCRAGYREELVGGVLLRQASQAREGVAEDGADDHELGDLVGVGERGRGLQVGRGRTGGGRRVRVG